MPIERFGTNLCEAVTGQLIIPPANDAGRREPAPGQLELIRQFVNTRDFEDGVEAIGTAGDLDAWLAARALLDPGERVSEAEVALALDVREALRSLLLANNGADPDAEAVETLNAAARVGPLRVSFGSGGESGALEPAGRGVAGALGRLLGLVYRAMEAGEWERLKACPAHDCMWAFYDHSRNRSKQWCEMGVCGNRAKARTYRERRRAH